LLLTGENSIIIVGGANQSGWQLSDDVKAAIAGAGAILLQREVPEAVNIEVAQVRGTEGLQSALAGAPHPATCLSVSSCLAH
jgi:ribokinase